MSVVGVATYAFGTALATGLGAGLLPQATNKVLRWKHGVMADAFERGCRRYVEAHEAVTEESPDVVSGVAKWAETMAWNEKLGKLEPWQAKRLAEVGVIEHAREDSDYLDEEARRWSFEASPRNRVICGVSSGVAAAAALSPILTVGLTPWPALPALVLLALVMVLAACDMRTKTLPWQLCACCAIPSTALALVMWGPGGLPWCVATALAVTALLGVVSYVMGAFGQFGGIGGGDLKVLPWVVLPLGTNGAVWGLVGCVALMFAGAVASLVTRRAGARDYLPMAPGIVVWYAFGLASLALPQLVNFGL